MMREIKFRGKRLDNGEWVYGSYVAHRTNVGADEMRHLIICNEEMSDQHSVDPKTVGQFTGLPDKSGAEIYDGDILRVDPFEGSNQLPKTREVIFDGGWFGTNEPVLPGGYACMALNASVSRAEIIGNIYENPELLEEE